MLIKAPGVLSGSEYFFGPKPPDEKLYYGFEECGALVCDKDYEIDREYYAVLLLLYVNGGTFHLEYDGTKYEAKAGDLVVFDCRRPHRYYCKDYVDFIFIHPTGGRSVEICEEITKESVILRHAGNSVFKEKMLRFLSFFKNNQDLGIYEVSALVYELLCAAHPPVSMNVFSENEGIIKAISLMKDRIKIGVTVKELAAASSMSESYFAHEFKRDTGVSPYEYMIRLRIDVAKHLLKTTKMTIGQISEEVGYGSDMGFIMAFNDRVGVSPAKYRKYPF